MMLEEVEYAVLNVPGFKLLKKDEHGDWTRVHTGEWATTPYQNPHRWWTGIKESEVGEYMSLKAKIKYWTPRQNKRDFNPEKFLLYKKSLDESINNYSEDDILYKIAQYEWAEDFMPKAAVDMFVF